MCTKPFGCWSSYERHAYFVSVTFTDYTYFAFVWFCFFRSWLSSSFWSRRCCGNVTLTSLYKESRWMHDYISLTSCGFQMWPCTLLNQMSGALLNLREHFSHLLWVIFQAKAEQQPYAEPFSVTLVGYHGDSFLERIRFVLLSSAVCCAAHISWINPTQPVSCVRERDP